MYEPFIFTYSFIDMPFSLVTDTLYLPKDIINVQHDKHDKRNSSTATNNVVSHIQASDLLKKPAMSPKQTEQWNMLPGP